MCIYLVWHYLYIYIHYVYLCVYVYIHIYIYICMYTYTYYICINVYIYINREIHILNVYICVYIYIYTHYVHMRAIYIYTTINFWYVLMDKTSSVHPVKKSLFLGSIHQYLALNQHELSGAPALRFPHEEPTPHVEALDRAGSMLYPPVSNVESWKIPELNEGL